MSLQRNERWVLPSATMALALLLTSCSGGAGYASAEDCVLKNVGSAQTDGAVMAIERACRFKFAPDQSERDEVAADLAEAGLDDAQAAARASAEAAAMAAGAQPASGAMEAAQADARSAAEAAARAAEAEFQ